MIGLIQLATRQTIAPIKQTDNDDLLELDRTLDHKLKVSDVLPFRGTPRSHLALSLTPPIV